MTDKSRVISAIEVVEACGRRASWVKQWRCALGVGGFLAAALSGNAAPVFSSVPAPRQVVNLGEALSLDVVAHGNSALTYQWRRNGRDLAGATSSTYALATTTGRDAGWYQVCTTDASGTTVSAVVFVNVNVPVANVVDQPVDVETRPPEAAPRAMEDVTAVAAGSLHTLALKSDGTVVAWGANDLGQATIPGGLSDVVAIAAAENHNLALTAGGRVIAWGADEYGQSKVPAGLRDVVAIATSGTHCLALRADRRVVAWGGGFSNEATVPSGLSDVTAIAAGFSWSLALKADGTVTSWGGSSENTAPAGLHDVIAIAAGSAFGMALRNDGTAVDWFRIGGMGAARLGPDRDSLRNMVTISVGMTRCAAIHPDGTVGTWETDYGDGWVILYPTPPYSQPVFWALRKVVAVSAGRHHVVVLRDASADAPPVIVSQPTDQIATVGSLVTFSVAEASMPGSSYQWYRNGTAIEWARGSTLTLTAVQKVEAGTLGTPSAGDYTVVVTNELGSVTSRAAHLTVLGPPEIVAGATARQVVSLGGDVTLNVTATSSDVPTFQWKHNGVPIRGATAASYPIKGATMGDAGWYQAMVSNSVGTTSGPVIFLNVAVHHARIVTWGSATSAINTSLVLDNVAAVELSGNGGYALRGDGTVTGWNGLTVPAGLTDVVALAAGDSTILALKADGTVTAWGSRSVAVVPAWLNDAVAVSCEGTAVFALRANGSLVTWGDSAPYDSPPRDLYNLAAFAAARDYLFGLKADGTLRPWVWSSGQGALTAIPASATDIAALATGDRHALILTNAGKVVAWGDNRKGQLDIPEGLGDVVAIAATASYSMALKQNGTVVTWGAGTYGPQNVPADLGRVAMIAAGSDECVALVDASPAAAPEIASQPPSKMVAPGGTATFSIATSGSATGCTYQWFLNGQAIEGETDRILTLTNVQPVAAGVYTVRITNPLGSVVSLPASLIVDPAQNPGRLVNLSVRSGAGNGSQTLIVGLVIGGWGASAAKPVLIRAVGPSLAPLGVKGVLTDPWLQIYGYGGRQVIASNDDWAGDAGVTRMGDTAGAFKLGSTSSNDAALATQLGNGTYSIHIAGFDGGSGVVLAEIYDTADASVTTAGLQRLLNISARAQVGAAEGTIITGFVLGGATNTPVLIRAVGPTLAAFGVSDALSDPVLVLYKGAAVVDTNDNWGGAPEITAAAARVGAFALPANSTDAVLLVSLPPGVYSAHVEGTKGASGVVLVEVYDAR